MPSARGLRADGLTMEMSRWAPAAPARIRSGGSPQGAEALAEVGSAVGAEGGNEHVENEDDPDDESEDEHATHGDLPFLSALVQFTRPNRTILGLVPYVNP